MLFVPNGAYLKKKSNILLAILLVYYVQNLKSGAWWQNQYNTDKWNNNNNHKTYIPMMYIIIGYTTNVWFFFHFPFSCLCWTYSWVAFESQAFVAYIHTMRSTCGDSICIISVDLNINVLRFAWQMQYHITIKWCNYYTRPWIERCIYTHRCQNSDILIIFLSDLLQVRLNHWM